MAGIIPSMNDNTANQILEQLVFIANSLAAIEKRLSSVEGAILRSKR